MPSLRRRVLLRYAAICGLLLLGSPAVAQTTNVRLIAASTTDAAIDDVIGVHHVAIDNAAARNRHLLLFLPGTTASAQDYATLIERTAVLGYHAIGLAYENEFAVNALCAGMGATSCHEDVRREILFGTDESPLVDVDFDNSVMNRLDRLLAHLEAIAPEEGWEAYRNAAGDVRWQRVVVSGHSQGAGHAAFLGRLEAVERVVMFSGTEPVAWTQAGDFRTPPESFHGFVHRLEPIYTPIQASWDNIGIPGMPISVDALAPPYAGSHQLFTLELACLGDPETNGFYHNCHCVDSWMPAPLPDGTPHFQQEWDHLFTLEAASPVPGLGPLGSGILITGLLIAGSWRTFGARSARALRLRRDGKPIELR